MIAVLLAWILLVLNFGGLQQEPHGGSGQGGKSGTSEGDDSSWWAGGNAKAKLKNEVPKGATGEENKRV